MLRQAPRQFCSFWFLSFGSENRFSVGSRVSEAPTSIDYASLGSSGLFAIDHFEKRSGNLPMPKQAFNLRLRTESNLGTSARLKQRPTIVEILHPASAIRHRSINRS